MKKSSPAAIFDVDGTLIPGFIIISLPQYLSEKGSFDSMKSAEINKLFVSFISGQTSAKILSKKIPTLFASGLKGQLESRVNEITSLYIAKYKKKMFSHSLDLVKKMKDRKFFMIAVSGSPDFAISKLSFLGFSETLGTSFYIKNGVYTGKVKLNLVNSKNKRKAVKSIIDRYNIDAAQSYGFGDTEHDLPVLRMVGNPIALNPNNKLSKVAEKNHWQTIRKKSDKLKL